VKGLSDLRGEILSNRSKQNIFLKTKRESEKNRGRFFEEELGQVRIIIWAGKSSVSALFSETYITSDNSDYVKFFMILG
jgi:hypothetical protein